MSATYQRFDPWSAAWIVDQLAALAEYRSWLSPEQQDPGGVEYESWCHMNLGEGSK